MPQLHSQRMHAVGCQVVVVHLRVGSLEEPPRSRTDASGTRGLPGQAPVPERSGVCVYLRRMAEPSTDDVVDVALKVWNYKMGEQVVAARPPRRRARPLPGHAGRRPADLGRAGRAHRAGRALVREWLRANAAAELLVTDADGVRFELTDAAAAVLADEDGSEWFAAGAFSHRSRPRWCDGMAEPFRTGVGLPYDAFGAAGAHSTARSLGPWVRAALVPRLLPRLDGVVEKLEAGARVADVGCGGGVALEALARAFPRSRFAGFDPSHHACHDARVRDCTGSTTSQIHETAGRRAARSKAHFDLVLTFDCLHDMPRPARRRPVDPRRHRPARARGWSRRSARPASYRSDRRNPLLALMYGMSVTTCLQSSLSEPGAEGYGTLGLPPARVEAMAHDAGFSTRHPARHRRAPEPLLRDPGLTSSFLRGNRLPWQPISTARIRSSFGAADADEADHLAGVAAEVVGEGERAALVDRGDLALLGGLAAQLEPAPRTACAGPLAPTGWPKLFEAAVGVDRQVAVEVERAGLDVLPRLAPLGEPEVLHQHELGRA